MPAGWLGQPAGRVLSAGRSDDEVLARFGRLFEPEVVAGVSAAGTDDDGVFVTGVDDFVKSS